MRKKLVQLSIFLLLFGSLFAQTQSPSALLSLQKTKILIGEPIELKLKLTFDKNLLINKIDFKDSIDNKIELLNEFDFDTLANDGNYITIQKRYLISCYDSARVIFKPINIFLSSKTDTINSVITSQIDSLLIEYPSIDINKDIKDIKAIEDEPFRWSEILPYVYWSFLLLILTILSWYFYKRWKNKQPLLELFKSKPIPAHILAFKQLKALDEKKLWHNGQVKEYYTELSDIFRLYLENRYEIRALEQISEEILVSLRELSIDDNLIGEIAEMLVLSDSVKFAKFIPLASDNSKSWNSVYRFVENTKLLVSNESEKEVEK